MPYCEYWQRQHKPICLTVRTSEKEFFQRDERLAIELTKKDRDISENNGNK